MPDRDPTGLNLNPTPTRISAYIVFGKILLLLIGQGSMIFPPIGRRNFANSAPAYLIIKGSLPRFSAFGFFTNQFPPWP